MGITQTPVMWYKCIRLNTTESFKHGYQLVAPMEDFFIEPDDAADSVFIQLCDRMLLVAP